MQVLAPTGHDARGGNENADGYGCCSSSPGVSPTTGEPDAFTSPEPYPGARLLAEVIAGCERSPPPRANNPASTGPRPSPAAGHSPTAAFRHG